MKTTIYIDKNLVPRYSPDGWPAPPGRYFTHYTVNGETAETGQRAWEIYRGALEKAKADSVPFEHHTAFYPALNACTTPDTFIECEIGEVEIVFVPHEVHGQKMVARVKTQAKDVPDNTLPDANDKNVASIDPGVTPYYNSAHGYTEGADIKEQNRQPAAHPEDFCQRCGALNTVWFAPNDLWNKVMGGDGGIVCPECFRKLCRESGEKIIFEAKSVNAIDGLKCQILEAFSAKWMAAGGAKHDYIMNTLYKTLSEILE